MAEVGDVETLAEPVAAAVHYAATERLESGGAVAVYDLGGGTFDAAVVRRTDDGGAGGRGGGGAAGGFELLGDVEGIERLGGIDLDEAVFQHVVRWCESAFAELDADDPTALQALARVRQECVAAKEALSADTDVAIPVVLPNLQTEVRLTRAEFEAMIRPLLQQTVEALRRAVRSADVDIADLAAVLLVGGSSQIPLAAELVAADLGRPIAVDQHPKHTVSLGAAIAGGRRFGAAVPSGSSPTAAASSSSDAAVSSASPAVASPTIGSSRTVPDSSRTVAPSPAAASAPDPIVVSPAASADPIVASPPAEAIPSPTSQASAGGPLASLLDDVAPTGTDTPTAHWQAPPQSSPGPDNRRSDTAVMPADRRPSGAAGPPPYGGDTFTSSSPERPRQSNSRLVPALGALVVAAIAVGGAIWAIGQRGTSSESDPGADGDIAADADEAADEAAGETADGVTDDPPADAEATSTTASTVASSTTSTTAPSSSTTAASSTTTTAPTVTGLSATITGIVIDGGRYAVSYSTNFTPLISSDPSSTHLHFFFDTVPVDQAGVPGGGPWILYDVPAPFTGYGPSDRPSGATQMCVTAANHAHEVVDPSIYHCMDLPDA